MHDPDANVSDPEDGHVTVWHETRKCHLYPLKGYWFIKEKEYCATAETTFRCGEYRNQLRTSRLYRRRMWGNEIFCSV